MQRKRRNIRRACSTDPRSLSRRETQVQASGARATRRKIPQARLLKAPASTIANGSTLGPNHAREAQEQASGARATRHKIPPAKLLKAPASTIASGSTLGPNHADPANLPRGALARLETVLREHAAS